ncbi:glycogen debranching N-terminal domain-containing protein [Flaviflagellibacter deserti]|uniref:Glycogen debranching N-terminal domain-containing protein n=1 Tax=Flaviflagellibacter deserti TaxID=2267266 RepID=A0ABV9Z1T5_9HYPH
MNETLPSQFYIPARTTLDGGRPSRLKHNDTFAVLDTNGDLLAWEGNPDGLYNRDTRHLSHFELRLNGARPMRLSSNVESDNAALTADLTNPDFFEGDRLALPKDTIHLHRLKFVWDGALFERIAIFNYDDEARRLRVSTTFDCDFADLFEARGQRRPGRGVRCVDVIGDGTVRFAYAGLDQVERTTELAFWPIPDRIEPSFAYYDMILGPQEKRVMFVRIACNPKDLASWEGKEYFREFAYMRRSLRQANNRSLRIASTNTLVQNVIRQSMADLTMLTTETPYGAYPYAGIPWFSTAFGRDGIITALMMLWVDPGMAKGVLSLLAHTQAKVADPFQDAEPGKILHEMRFGEMAALREVPFGLYYGSVDSTPLFVMLAGAYLSRTGDVETIRSLWPNIQAALGWITNHGDVDDDGFVEYRRQRDTGLVNQGWKDSVDSIFHTNGDFAEGPIALCEVQGYVYAAWREAAAMARALGHDKNAITFDRRAEDIRKAFEEKFWIEELGTYAIALDGQKRPCAVASSNAGHALFTGIVHPDRAKRVAALLMEPESFSGWGIRTISTSAARYNPMSYHNGSIWPHDNGLIALGFARYGLKDAVLKVFKGLIEAAGEIELNRLPELFCGFGRKQRQGPIGYPVSCSPQAWAAATPLALIQASLGLTLEHSTGDVRLNLPVLPDFIDKLCLHNVTLGEGGCDLLVSRHGTDVAVTVLDRRGDIRVIEIH